MLLLSHCHRLPWHWAGSLCPVCLPPLNEYQALATSTTTLKRLCQHYGIQRWPFRQVSVVDRTVARLQAELEAALPTLASADLAIPITDHIRDLRAHRQDIVKVWNKASVLACWLAGPPYRPR